MPNEILYAVLMVYVKISYDYDIANKMSIGQHEFPLCHNVAPLLIVEENIVFSLAMMKQVIVILSMSVL